MSEPQSTTIVTGAASGIGLATARLLLDEGRRVAVVDLPSSALGELYADSDACAVIAADIADPASVERIYAEVDFRFGRLDAVANIAGISLLQDQLLEDLEVEDFDRVISVNLRGAFLMCKRALPPLRSAGGGSIVNLGSVASVRGLGGAAYVASKHGVLGLTRAIAHQYAAAGIRCNLVAPGATDTPMLALARQKAVVTAPNESIIAGAASPVEVAELIAYLTSERARFISGSTFSIDGGQAQA